MNEFGNYLKELRGDRSVREVARAIGISHTYLTTLEKGFDPRTKKPRKPHPDVINKLASYYGLHNGDLAIRAGYDPFEYVQTESKFAKLGKKYTLSNGKGEIVHPTSPKNSDDLFDILQMDKQLYFKDQKLSQDDKKKIITLIETILN
jgi:transcriptional regulator with XRE-family HTH domain